MKIAAATAVFALLLTSAALAEDAPDPWLAASPVTGAVSGLVYEPLPEGRIVPVSPALQQQAVTLLEERPVVRLDAATFTRLSGRDAWPAGLKPYLVRAVYREDGLGANHVSVALRHVLVEYQGPIVSVACRHTALILLLPFAPKLHLSVMLYG
jgi:hypothetical protein